METRKYGRYRVEYSGSFLGDGITASGVILNLSEAGCRAHSAVTLIKGKCYRVLIDVPRYKTPLHVARALVRWSHGEDFGMQFIHIEPDHQQRLRELIRAI
jgi:PilZ domain